MISPRPAPSHPPPRATLKAGAILGLSLGMVVLAGCAYRGGIDRPITLKATWFRYMNGDDIRAARVPGAEDRKFEYVGGDPNLLTFGQIS